MVKSRSFKIPPELAPDHMEEVMEPRCVVCHDDGVVDNGAGENIPCDMCQFVNGLPRPSVVRFADDMEQRLRENDHKGGWSRETKQHMANIMARAVQDLLLSLVSNASVQYVTTRAADVANIAMMIADNEQSGAWPAQGQVIQDIDNGKYLKYNSEQPDRFPYLEDFPYIHVDRANKAEQYEFLEHAMQAAVLYGEAGRRYRIIDFDAGGIQYIMSGGQWVIEQPGIEADALPAERVIHVERPLESVTISGELKI